MIVANNNKEEKLFNVNIIPSDLLLMNLSKDLYKKSSESLFDENICISENTKYLNLHYGEKTNAATINYSSLFEELNKFVVNDITVSILSNNPKNGQSNSSPKTSVSDIISIIDTKKEESTMGQQLLAHRDKVEKWSSLSGLALGSIAIFSALHPLVQLAAVLPGTLMFYTIPAFMYFRKWLRSDQN
ncbi:hypothetical protein SAMN05421743_12127 [Thalassobacillus cyri]|uniref:Uncharacterized protein n=1 Tax=Thalassobacillus cyri TaxID=571932 RepID=A0A1H4H1B1_9BACI|nr:hypothetical protein [Thalassobacillus cyri]SEB15647.1 hypothetical protein SAMN05421743_12127 [Thalassobacillus cyri]